MNEEMMTGAGSGFVQTNEPRNRVLAFARDEMGGLARPIAYETGGVGTGAAHLPSQAPWCCRRTAASCSSPTRGAPM